MVARQFIAVLHMYCHSACLQQSNKSRLKCNEPSKVLKLQLWRPVCTVLQTGVWLIPIHPCKWGSQSWQYMSVTQCSLSYILKSPVEFYCRTALFFIKRQLNVDLIFSMNAQITLQFCQWLTMNLYNTHIWMSTAIIRQLHWTTLLSN